MVEIPDGKFSGAIQGSRRFDRDFGFRSCRAAPFDMTKTKAGVSYMQFAGFVVVGLLERCMLHTMPLALR